MRLLQGVWHFIPGRLFLHPVQLHFMPWFETRSEEILSLLATISLQIKSSAALLEGTQDAVIIKSVKQKKIKRFPSIFKTSLEHNRYNGIEKDNLLSSQKPMMPSILSIAFQKIKVIVGLEWPAGLLKILMKISGTLQLIATEPKLQISTIKTKYLASSFFQIL